MRKTSLWVVTLVLLVLVWLALDDITTGSESSYGTEWAMVAAAVVWLLWLATRLRRRTTDRADR